MEFTKDIVGFNFPTHMFCGAGARKKLPGILKQRGFTRPLIVTDKGVAELPFMKEISADLRAQGMTPETFSGIWGNPVKSQVTAGNQAYKAARADCIVSVGGGAALDVAKAIALMVNHPGDLFDYEDGKPDARPVNQPVPFIVAIPTTAGTGSEVGRSAVVSDDVTHAKKIIFDPKLLAGEVLLDPELTTGLPAKMTAATGMDALTHLIEAYLAKGYHPICEGIALEGIVLGNCSLVKCVQEPNNLDARGQMLVASAMGAVAFQKGLGVTHSLAHALSTVVDMHHGTANGILLPYAMKFNLATCRSKFERLAACVGEKTAEGFIDWTIRLKEQVGMPRTLGEMGVKKEHLPKLVEFAFADTCHQSNPRPVTKADIEKMFLEAIG